MAGRAVGSIAAAVRLEAAKSNGAAAPPPPPPPRNPKPSPHLPYLSFTKPSLVVTTEASSLIPTPRLVALTKCFLSVLLISKNK